MVWSGNSGGGGRRGNVCGRRVSACGRRVSGDVSVVMFGSVGGWCA